MSIASMRSHCLPSALHVHSFDSDNEGSTEYLARDDCALASRSARHVHDSLRAGQYDHQADLLAENLRRLLHLCSAVECEDESSGSKQALAADLSRCARFCAVRPIADGLHLSRCGDDVLVT